MHGHSYFKALYQNIFEYIEFALLELFLFRTFSFGLFSRSRERPFLSVSTNVRKKSEVVSAKPKQSRRKFSDQKKLGKKNYTRKKFSALVSKKNLNFIQLKLR